MAENSKLLTGLSAYSDEYINLLVQKINELYIMTRYKYLAMFVDKAEHISKWSTVNLTLTDYQVRKHLHQKSTVGVFSGEALTKFICFDVDSKSVGNSKHVTTLLRNTLITEFHVPDDSIYISFSGKKGYHVEIFFDEAINIVDVQNFYQTVEQHMRENYSFQGEIEFRPTHSQGVKLPLSIHHETGNVCWFVDKETFETIEEYDYLLGIVPMDVEVFKSKVLDSSVFSKVFTMEIPPAQETERLMHRTKPFVKNEQDFADDAEELLSENHLLRSHSRHTATLKLATYLYNRGNTLEESVSIIEQLLQNTWKNFRYFISQDTSYAYMMSEVRRLVKHVYESNYQPIRKEYFLYKQELLEILALPTKTLRTLMFSMYIHSKKYAKLNGVFYMAYSVMGKMGNSKNPTKVLVQLLRLEEMGYIEIVKRNQTDKSRTILANQQSNGSTKRISETNEYRITLNSVDIKKEPYLKVQFDESISIYNAATSLVSEKEAKEKLPVQQFYKEFKQFY